MSLASMYDKINGISDNGLNTAAEMRAILFEIVDSYIPYTGTTVTSTAFITVGGTSDGFVKGDGTLDLNTYLTAETDSQTLSLSGTSLSISSGNTVSLSGITTNLSGHVPYSGATSNVNLNTRSLLTADINGLKLKGNDNLIAVGKNSSLNNTHTQATFIGAESNNPVAGPPTVYNVNIYNTFDYTDLTQYSSLITVADTSIYGVAIGGYAQVYVLFGSGSRPVADPFNIGFPSELASGWYLTQIYDATHIVLYVFAGIPYVYQSVGNFTISYAYAQMSEVYNNVTGVGYGAVVTKSNQLTLGNSGTTEIHTYGAIRSRAYGSGAKTGTTVYGIGVDSTGNLIESNLIDAPINGITYNRKNGAWVTDTGIGTLQQVTTAGNQTNNKVIVEGVQFNNYTNPWSYEIIGAVAVINAEEPQTFVADQIGNFYFTRGNVVNYTTGTWLGKIDTNGVYSEIATGGLRATYLATDNNNNVYVVNSDSQNITKVTVGGTASIFATLGFAPTRITTDALGNVYVAQELGYIIRKITPLGVISTLNGVALTQYVRHMVVGHDGYLYIALNGLGAGIAKMSTSTGSYTILGTADFNSSPGMAIDSNNNIITTKGDGIIVQKTTQGGVTTTVWAANGYINDVAVDANDYIFVTSRPNATKTTRISPDGVALDILLGQYGENIVIGAWDNSPYYYNSNALELRKVVEPLGKVLILDSSGNIQENFNLYIGGGLAYLPNANISVLTEPKAIATVELVNTKLQKEIVDTTYTISLADNNYTVFFNSSSGVTVTVDTGLPNNFECDFYNLGVGTVTFVAGTATLGTPDGTALATDKVCSLIKVLDTNNYKLKGELV